MDLVTVTTKEQLKKAKEDKVDVIVVEGELAEKLKRSKKVAIAAAGVSGVALTGIEIASIILAGSIGITLLVGIFKDYEEIEASTSGGIKLKRKQKD